MPENLTSLKNPFRLVINTFLFLFFILLLLYLGIEAFRILGDPLYRDKADNLYKDYVVFLNEAWRFARPLVQLVLILAIVEWILKRLGIALFGERIVFEWNIQTIIAIIVVSAFALVALSGGAIDPLKDVALVVVGFYFGTQKKADGAPPTGGPKG
jgi:hypothetical protein